MLLRTKNQDSRGRGMRAAAAALLAVLLLAAATTVIGVVHGARFGESTAHSGVVPSAVSGSPEPVATTVSTGIPSVASLSAAAADVTQGPDEFARAFATGLLNQDFRIPRSALLAWVQAHSAVSPEPLVMGLIPPSARPTWAVASVTDASGGTAAISDRDEWARLATLSGYQEVDIQRVSEPYAWVAAVAAGKITDPGVTAREVVAVVTRHTIEGGQPRTARTSVVLDINLEGPPTRGTWAFVTLVTYTSIEMPA